MGFCFEWERQGPVEDQEFLSGLNSSELEREPAPLQHPPTANTESFRGPSSRSMAWKSCLARCRPVLSPHVPAPNVTLSLLCTCKRHNSNRAGGVGEDLPPPCSQVSRMMLLSWKFCEETC